MTLYKSHLTQHAGARNVTLEVQKLVPTASSHYGNDDFEHAHLLLLRPHTTDRRLTT